MATCPPKLSRKREDLSELWTRLRRQDGPELGGILRFTEDDRLS